MRLTRPRERSIEAKFVKLAHEAGMLTVKLTMIFNRGWPDRLVLGDNGRMLFIEFKRRGSHKLTEHQALMHGALIKRGFDVFTTSDAGEAFAMAKKVLKWK